MYTKKIIFVCKNEIKQFTLVGNVPLRQDSGASTSSQVSTDVNHGIMRQKSNMVGAGNVTRQVGSLPDGLYRSTVSQGTPSPSLTSTGQELNPLGISLSLIK